MSGATKISGELQAGTSGTTDSSAMETEEYYNPEGGEWSQKVDTGQLCRVCANPNEYLIPIFDGEGLEHELSVKIEKHLPIKVTETDALPQQMCYQCASTLIAWHDLVLNCVEADKKLRELQADEDDDDDDKGAEMFESHSMDSDPADEVDQPSTSESQITAKLQVPKKTVLSKDKKPKLKMVLVKGSLAGTSGQKTVAKTQVAKALELAKSKEGGNEDSASERFGQPSLTSGNSLEQVHYIIKEEEEDLEGAITQDDRKKRSKFQMLNNEPGALKSGLEAVSEDEMNIKAKTDMMELKDCEAKGAKDRVRKSRESKLCKKASKLRRKLKHPMIVHNSSIPVRCKICAKSFSLKSSLNRHVREVHEQVKNFRCDVCGKTFSSRQTLEVHQRTHTGERPYMCDICGKSFSHRFSLTTHKSIHAADKPFNCDLCKKSFKRHVQLVKHKLKHSKGTKKVNEPVEQEMDEPQLFECEHCGKILRSRSTMISHLLIHSGIRPCICHVCGKHFRLSNSLKRHLKEVHEQIRNHKCETCGRMFINQRNLEDHWRTHTGERPFVCESCGKCFKTKAALYIHNLIHKGVFPHKCSVCDRRFYREADVARHMSVHTQEKAYVCDICEKAFPRNNALVRHKLVHSDATFPCVDCGQKFRQERYLRRHKKNKLKCNKTNI